LISLLAIFLGATTLLAAPADDFYDSAFRRGVAAFEAETYDVALGRLRIAAFGYVEDLPRYEMAEAYIAIAAQRLNRPDEAKIALRRIISAERIEQRFASLQISPALRGAIVDAAKALLTPSQAALLTMPPAEPQIAAPTPTPPPRVEITIVPDPIVVTPAPQQQPARDPAAILADADRALHAGDLAQARTGYASLLALSELPHATLLKAGEGLCRARDFLGAVRAFKRAGAFAKGEEPYRYYYAVALYESGRYRDAKRELAAALPFIEATPDVERYRAKIEHSLD
jgi:tetratricopeptide (TPR) repeat protein